MSDQERYDIVAFNGDGFMLDVPRIARGATLTCDDCFRYPAPLAARCLRALLVLDDVVVSVSGMIQCRSHGDEYLFSAVFDGPIEPNRYGVRVEYSSDGTTWRRAGYFPVVSGWEPGRVVGA